MRALSFSILFVLSVATPLIAPYIDPALLIAARLLWLALFVGLSVSLAVKWVRSRPAAGTLEIEGIFLAILLIHAVALETGGPRSPVILFYILVVLFSSFYFGLFKNMVGVTGILFLEGIQLYLSSPEEFPREAIFFPLLLVLIPLIVKGYLKSFAKEREALWGRFNRLQSSVETLEPLPEIHEKMELAQLSEEKKQDGALALADRMETDLENLLQVILSGRPQIHRAVLYFFNRGEETLWVRAAKGREQAGIDRQKVIRLGEGILGWIAKEKRTVSIADLQSQKGKLDYDDGSAQARSLLAVPLMDKEIFEGMICVDSGAEHAFSDPDEQLLQLVAREILRVLQYYREQKKMGEQTRVYSALLEISKNLGSRLDLTHRLETTLASAKQIVDYDTCFIFLVEPGERRMTVKAVQGYDLSIIDYNFALTNGLLSIIVKNRQVLLFSNTLVPPGGPRIFSNPHQNKIFPDGCRIQLASNSFLGLPMVIDDRVIGVLLFSSMRENAFSTYDRHVLSIMCNHVASSIAEAQAHALVEKMAVTDGLTGIFNHRRFQERLAEEVARVARHPEPFSLLLIDIDFFKKINDTFGHPAGDAVIKLVTKTLVKMVRKVDIVARYGGEEFVILLLKSDSAQAFQMAERIRKAIEAASIDWQGKKISATVSIGVASQPQDATKREDLIAYADRALYASKKGGRNRTTLYKDLTADMYEVG
ncbi:MAG TPA: diguanylate cyclase [Candidatus Manganitrophaceae bacterium]|nr:diguanylate cyclase [Candidatus Manganitrophaceae bacterium]